jgi:hypothetical protein
MGLAGGAESVAEQNSFAAQLGVLAIAQRLFTGPRQVPHGFLCHLGARDRGAIPCARQARQLHGVPAVGFDAVPGFFWHE